MSGLVAYHLLKSKSATMQILFKTLYEKIVFGWFGFIGNSGRPYRAENSCAISRAGGGNRESCTTGKKWIVLHSRNGRIRTSFVSPAKAGCGAECRRRSGPLRG
jgi:hypothetical protein